MNTVTSPSDSALNCAQNALLEVSFDDDHYLLLWPENFAIPELLEASYLTVFKFDQHGSVKLQWIQNAVRKYKTTDDVFRPEFLKAVLFGYASSTDLDIADDARNFLYDQGTTVIATHRVAGKGQQLTQGPYHYTAGTLRPVWKLYEDTHSAFLHTLILDKDRKPFRTRTAGLLPQTLTVAVPSRLRGDDRNGQGAQYPLQDWRIAVKDNFCIQGVRTSACNRAYYELYPPAEKTAACIQKLYDAGACIVGTTKLASFAATEEPMECIDWQAPFNPRADGYQSPAGSSSGSGAAAAAYSWLDITVGSDTSGSGRRPGHWNGCFAMRPSHGYLSHEGFLDSFPRFDVPTFFGRELTVCRAFAKAWYGQALPNQNSTDLKISIVYPSDYMGIIGNESQLKLIDAFVADLERTYDVHHKNISFEEAWQSDPPPEAHGAALADYMKNVSRDSFFYEDYHNFEAFRRTYRATFGRDAYISPPVRWQWNMSSHITSEAHAEAMKRLEVYREWFERVITKLGEQNTLVIIPIEEISPRYRDEMPPKHFNPVCIPNLFLSPILKAPELTVPIGEFEYQSKVSGNLERLPVAISVIGPPGQDILLFDLVLKCLEQSGRPDRVLAGSKLFPDI